MRAISRKFCYAEYESGSQIGLSYRHNFCIYFLRNFQSVRHIEFAILNFEFWASVSNSATLKTFKHSF